MPPTVPQRSTTSPITLLHARSPFSTYFRCSAASQVSNKPASDSVPHPTQNAREEAAAVASTIAKGIAGVGGKGDYDPDPASVTRPQVAGDKAGESLNESFVRCSRSEQL